MASERDTVEIVSVNVGMPAVLLSRPSGDIISGIDKRRVAERHPAGVTVMEAHRAIDGGGIGPEHLQNLSPLSLKARRKLQVAGRDLTGGVPESD